MTPTLTPADVPFEPNATTYSLNNAYWLARAAAIAYQETDTIQPAVEKLGLDKFEFLSKDDTEGYIAANDDLIMVAFRGTEPSKLQDLLSDAKLHKVPGPLGKVHRGFLGAVGLVRNDMLGHIERFRNKDKPQTLWLTGHSLGAALAVVAAAHLLEAGQKVDGLYNFGQPRVGSDEFAEEFDRRIDGRHFRFVNNNDSVTRVPPRSFGYGHTGILRYIDSAGEIQEDIGFWHAFLDRISGRIEDFLKPGTEGLKDHFMAGYVERLENALKSRG